MFGRCLLPYDRPQRPGHDRTGPVSYTERAVARWLPPYRQATAPATSP